MTTAGLARLLLLAATALALAACGETSSAGTGTKTPTAAPSPTLDPQALAAAWQKKGASEVPPDSLRQVNMTGIEVVNQTGGAVSEADARRWAESYLRSVGYEFWAWNHQQDQFLLVGGLSRVPRTAFNGDLTTIAAARAANMRIEVNRLQIRRFVLRAVPESLKDLYTRFGYVWTPYTFYLDQVGPSDLYWLDAQGQRVANKAHVAAGIARPELVGGQLSTDPLMGDVWSQDSDFDCSDSASRERFGALCNP